MVPHDKKEKLLPNEVPANIKKRRNSISDSSASSASSSSTCSSTASGTDSDGSSTAGSACDNKGTMTTPPIDVEAGMGANSNGFFDSENISSLGYEQRPINKVSALGQKSDFRSLADEFPNGVDMVSPRSTERSSSSPTGEGEKGKDKKKNGKAGNKKKREKKRKDKDENSRKQQGSPLPRVKAYNFEEIREMMEFNQLKDTLYKTNAGATPNEISYASGSQTFFDPNQIKHCGIGIAATGYYDKLPRFVYKNRGSDRKYSSLYSETDYVTELDQHLRSEKSVDRIKSESEYLSSMFSRMGSLITKVENRWIRNLLYLIIGGRINKVWRRINIIEKTLREKPGNHTYSLMPRAQLLELITKGLIDLLNDPVDNTNVFMYLSSTFVCDKSCKNIKHGRCMTLDLLLSLLPPSERRKVLSQECIKNNRRAVHFASVSGQMCQLDVLLKYDVDPNVFDGSHNAPIYYIRQRNNVMMVRTLLWHGADISLVHPLSRTVPYGRAVPESQDLTFWLMSRQTAMERCLLSWVKSMIGNIYTVYDNPLSRLHQIRLAVDGDSTKTDRLDAKIDSNQPVTIQRDFELSLKNGDSKAADEQVILIALPICYSLMDIATPAAFPHIVRTKICKTVCGEETPIALFTDSPALYTPPSGPNYFLSSAINEEHNGHIYVYKINKDLKQNEQHRIRFNIDPTALGERAHYTHLLVQTFVCKSKQTKAKIE